MREITHSAKSPFLQESEDLSFYRSTSGQTFLVEFRQSLQNSDFQKTRNLLFSIISHQLVISGRENGSSGESSQKLLWFLFGSITFTNDELFYHIMRGVGNGFLLFHTMDLGRMDIGLVPLASGIRDLTLFIENIKTAIDTELLALIQAIHNNNVTSEQMNQNGSLFTFTANKISQIFPTIPLSVIGIGTIIGTIFGTGTLILLNPYIFGDGNAGSEIMSYALKLIVLVIKKKIEINKRVAKLENDSDSSDEDNIIT